MSTPYDRKILVANWMGSRSPGDSIAQAVAEIRDEMPNVAGIILHTSDGINWLGDLDDLGPKAVTGIESIEQWVQACNQAGLEVHVQGKPRALKPIGAHVSPDIDAEAGVLVAAASVPGVKSLLIEVQAGPLGWQGSQGEIEGLMTQVREKAADRLHIGMILDGRRNRPFSFWIEHWIPFVDSLHPTVYPITFGRSQTIGQHMDEAFHNLIPYDRPIVPLLQAHAESGGRPTPLEILQQAEAAWARGAPGISLYRLGADPWSGDGLPHMGDPEYEAIARIELPAPPGIKSGPTYTWQNVINALVTVSIRVGEDWRDWWSAAGLASIFDNSLRQQSYSGPKIEHWPIEQAWIDQILELVVLDPATLSRITADAQLEKDKEDQQEAINRRQQRGSIIGIHGAPGIAAPRPDTWDHWIGELERMGIKWYKLCDNGDPNDRGPHSVYSWARRLKQAGIEPIIRYMASFQFPNSLPDHFFDKMRHYAHEGIVWAEIGNEPNLLFEWSGEWHTSEDNPEMRHTNPEAIRIVAETWIKDAKSALEAGVRPAFYAMAPTDWHGGYNPYYSSVFYTRKVVAYLAEHRRAETMDIFEQGGWIAVHTATYEQPIDFDPQRPDGTTWDMALRGYEVVLDAFRDSFGDELEVDDIPIMSTEGGVFTPQSTSMDGHVKLESEEEHAELMVAMFKWLEQNSPLQAMCPWCISVGGKIGHFHGRFQHDGWIEEVNGHLRPLPVCEAMENLRKEYEREEAEEETASAAIKLSVPYISQWDETAALHNADCGPTCMAMLANAGREVADYVTVDDLYEHHLAHKQPGDFTFLHEMLKVGNGEGLNVQRKDYPNRVKALEELQALVEQNTAFVILVNYAKWDHVAKNNFKFGHFVVVTGYDPQHVFVHDPLFSGSRRSEGESFAWSHELFLDGWGGFDPSVNPNYVAIVPAKQVARL
jgi:hypothetical protein